MQNLAAQLAAYAAAGTGHQNGLAQQATLQQVCLGWYSFAAQQVFYIELAKVLYRYPSAC